MPMARSEHPTRKDSMSQPAGSAHVSPWAPFRHRAFFWLWLGVVVSSVGAWAQTVGAQWLFVDDPDGATIVTLVQTATTLPMVLLALPAGVLATRSTAGRCCWACRRTSSGWQYCSPS